MQINVKILGRICFPDINHNMPNFLKKVLVYHLEIEEHTLSYAMNPNLLKSGTLSHNCIYN